MKKLLGFFLFAVICSSSAHAVVQESQYRALMDAIRKAESHPNRAEGLLPTLAPQVAEIESLTLDAGCAQNDIWCPGKMVVGGQTVILPRNLLIDLPANRLTLKQIFTQAQPACIAAGQSGLARTDTCRITTKGAYAALSANRDDCGQVIAGDVFIQNGPEMITGRVTAINYTEGSFNIDNTLVRMNDPSGTHSIQQGSGCAANSVNCSPDIRFTNDTVNYTTSFINGYPLCIPSQVITPGHSVASNANGVGDPLCPDTNRSAAVAPNFFVQDSRRFAPLKVGDSVTAMGGFVTVGGVTFLSAHTITNLLGLSTREAADQPDYFAIKAVRWNIAPFPERKPIAVFVGLTTLPNSQVDLFALRVDPRTNENFQDPLASTVGNPRTTNKLLAGPGGKFHIALDIPFLKGAPVTATNSACTNLINAGFDSCPNGGTLAEELSILAPPSREIQGVTRRTVPLRSNVFTVDLRNRQASNGQYTMPLGANLGGFIIAEPGEVNLGEATGPLIMEALPWTLDRRTSPNGCSTAGCENTAQRLIPYPVSGIDLRGATLANVAPPAAIDRILTFFTSNGGTLVPHVFPTLPPSSCVGVQ